MGAYTAIGASKPWPDLFGAMQEAAKNFVDIHELQAKIGQCLARLVGTEAAMVSSGAAGAITLGTCACLTGKDLANIRQLPDITSSKREVVIQAPHRNPFDHCVRSTGAKLVVVENVDQFRNVVGDNTAMMYFLGSAQSSPIPLECCLEVARDVGFPLLVDAANMLPPWENVRRVASLKVDLVCISGGKHMRGPQGSGILAGRHDLIEAALLNSSPYEDTFGRSMKVGRDEMVALWLAAERYARLDFAAMEALWLRQAEYLVQHLSAIPDLKVEIAPYESVRRIPRVKISWDEKMLRFTGDECEKRLLEGEPRIAVLRSHLQGIVLAPFMADPGDERLVARRFQEIFSTL